MTNKRLLKAYVRFDGTGRVVSSSLVLRKSKPKVGKWKEIPGYECCNQAQQTITVNVQGTFPIVQPDFVLESDDLSPYMYFFNLGNPLVTVTTLEELAAYNNTRYNAFGSFTVSGTSLLFTPNSTTAALFAANGTSVLAGYSFGD